MVGNPVPPSPASLSDKRGPEDGVSFGVYSTLSFSLIDYVHAYFFSLISPPGLRFFRRPGSLRSPILLMHFFYLFFLEKETLVLPPLSKDSGLLLLGRILWAGIRFFFLLFRLPGEV